MTWIVIRVRKLRACKCDFIRKINLPTTICNFLSRFLGCINSYICPVFSFPISYNCFLFRNTSHNNIRINCFSQTPNSQRNHQGLPTHLDTLATFMCLSPVGLSSHGRAFSRSIDDPGYARSRRAEGPRPPAPHALNCTRQAGRTTPRKPSRIAAPPLPPSGR